MPNLDSAQDVFYALADGWFGAKTALELGVGVDDKALHLAAGMVLQLVFCALLRLPLSNWRPWLLVCVLEFANEASDLYWSAIAGDASLLASAVDITMTLAIPTLLVVWARRNQSRTEPAPPAE